MTRVTRSGLQAALQPGVDLESGGLGPALEGTGVSGSALRRLDRDGDGRLQGRGELGVVFDLIERLDAPGTPASFGRSGRAGAVYTALLGARLPPATLGTAVARAARERAAADGKSYAFEQAPTSPLPTLSGNPRPGASRPAWLKDQNKCNQFVGDALVQAGARMPTHRVEGGGEHYVRAEQLPGYRDHFQRVTRLAAVREGDVLVVDHPGRGDSTAHAEVVTRVGPAGALETTGAHADGAYPLQSAWRFEGAVYRDAEQAWQAHGVTLYLLRPVRGAK